MEHSQAAPAVEAAAAVIAAEGAPAPEAPSEAESEGADWDALDLDEIALPGQKSSKEIAAEKVRPRSCSRPHRSECHEFREGSCDS